MFRRRMSESLIALSQDRKHMPRFHEEGDEEGQEEQQEGAELGQEEQEEKDQQERAGVEAAHVDLEKGTAPSAAATPRSVRGAAVTGGPPDDAESRLARRLASIEDPDVRAALDPRNTSVVTEAEILAWPDEKIIKLVKAFDLSDLDELMRKMRSGQFVGSGGETAAELITSLSWRNLYYSIDGSLLLQNVSGYVKPGTIVGVLGGPDGGATTLLDVLAQRTGGRGETLGEVFLNRRPIKSGSKHAFAKQLGYVGKADTHLPQLTVSETLYFSARLRNRNTTARSAILRVAITMKLLGLLHTWNTIVGDDFNRGISGGEKRRVSFGLEMVAGHNLILADLPTNGLDSGSALSLLQVYKSTTALGRSMLCSLVQPSPAIYNLLDMVLVLSKGATLYFGPSDLAVIHLDSLGFAKPREKSVPQYLEELSAAPEKFCKPMLLGAQIGAAPDGPVSPTSLTHRAAMARRVLKSQRPLFMLRQREEAQGFLKREKRLGAAPSFSGDKHPQGDKTASASPLSQARGLPQHQPAPDASSHGRGMSVEMTPMVTRPDGSSSPPALMAGPGSLDVLQGAPLHLLASGGSERYDAWRLLVSGFSDSIIAEDLWWVLQHELTPVPVFEEKTSKAMRRRKAQEAKRAEAAAKKARKERMAAASAEPSSHMHAIKMGASAAQETGDEDPAAGSPASTPLLNRNDEAVSPFSLQYWENLTRLIVLFYRNRSLWLLNFVKSAFFGLMIGTLFYNLSLTQGNVRTRFGLFYFALTFNSANAQQLVPVLLSFRRVFNLQKEARYYNP